MRFSLELLTFPTWKVEVSNYDEVKKLMLHLFSYNPKSYELHHKTDLVLSKGVGLIAKVVMLAPAYSLVSVRECYSFAEVWTSEQQWRSHARY